MGLMSLPALMRTMIANSSTFQTLVGEPGDATAAAEYVFFGRDSGVPTSGTFAIVGDAPDGAFALSELTSGAGIAKYNLGRRAEFVLRQLVASDTAAAATTFRDNFGTIIQHISALEGSKIGAVAMPVFSGIEHRMDSPGAFRILQGTSKGYQLQAIFTDKAFA